MTYFCNQTNLVQNLDQPVSPCGTDAPVERCAGCMLRNGLGDHDAQLVAADWRLLGESVVRGAQAAIYVSEGLREQFEGRLGWKPKRSKVMLPAMRWPQKLERVPADGDIVRFAFFGHAVPVKGLDVLLEAVRIVASRSPERAARLQLDIHGDLVDDGTGHHALVTAGIAELPNVTAHGHYAADQLPALLAQTDWMVCSSRFEASPLVVHEAAACGVPAIGPRIGGVPEKIGDGGLLFTSADPASLADALERALEPGVRESCAANVQVPPSVSDQAAQLLELYRELAAAETDRPPVPPTSVIMVVRDDPVGAHTTVSSLIEAGWDDADELIVINDGSANAQVDAFLQTLEGSVTIVENGRPAGFAHAANQAAARARGERIVVLRSGMELDADWRDVHAVFSLSRADFGRCGGFDAAFGDGAAEAEFRQRLALTPAT
jgi:hypothetical protein